MRRMMNVRGTTRNGEWLAGSSIEFGLIVISFVHCEQDFDDAPSHALQVAIS